jgi:hypothetical protein
MGVRRRCWIDLHWDGVEVKGLRVVFIRTCSRHLNSNNSLMYLDILGFLLQAKNDLRGDNSTFYLGTGLPLQHFSRCPSDRHPWPQQR